jgi:hypothetical protein
VIKRLPQQFNELKDRCHHLEQILEIGEGTINYCFSYFTETAEERKPSGIGAKVKTKITVSRKGREKEINVFNTTSIGPTLAGKQHAFGTNAFGTNALAIEATEGIATQKARPI